jgi:hypothetical protein
MEPGPFFGLIMMKKPGRQGFRVRAMREILLSLLIVSLASLQSVRAATCSCFFDSSSTSQSLVKTCCCEHCNLPGMHPGEEQTRHASLQTAQKPSGALLTTVAGETGKGSVALTDQCQFVQGTENAAIKSSLSFSPPATENSPPISSARVGRAALSAIKCDPLLSSGRSSPIYLATSALLI